jgi:LPXTG-site transpeptidase (sortase) family protein
MAASITGGDSRNDANPTTSGLTWTIASLGSGGSVNLTYQGLVLASGTYDNYAEVTDHDQTDSDSIPGNGSTTEDDDDTVTVTVTAITPPTIAKSFSPSTIASGGTSQLTITLGNSNGVTATLTSALVDTLPANVVVETPNGLGGTCPGATSAPAGGSTITYPSGGTIPAGGCTVVVDVTSSTAGTHTNTIAAGDLQTDLGSNAGPASDDLTVTQATVVDPAVTKSGDPTTASVGDTVVFTLVVFNEGNTTATNVRIVDPVPSFLTVTNVVSSPAETANNTVGNTVDLLYATVAPTDVFTITITTVVNASATPPGGPNNVTLTADADDDLTDNFDSEPITIVDPGLVAPETGFAPGRTTSLPVQPEEKAYVALGDLWLEIPSLGVETTIVGVPQTGGGWDVSWLWDDAGYLNGTAFPTWAGNSVITAHVTLPTGAAGPFADLKDLRFGDQVVIHAWGLRHVYEVREQDLVSPFDREIFRHEELSWLTLVTCHGFDERENAYRWRVSTRAVLVSIESDSSQPSTSLAGPPVVSPAREDRSSNWGGGR